MRGRRRAVMGTAAIVLAFGAGWLGLCLRYVAHPQVDPVEHVDAMYVIGPVETRWDSALGRADEGIAPVLLATRSIDSSGHAYFPPNCGEQRQGYTIQCVVPDPYTTRGEARQLAEQVRVHGWTHVAVFTSTAHTARTRMLMERCVPATVSVWNYPVQQGPPIGWLGEFLYQSGAWVKAELIRSC